MNATSPGGPAAGSPPPPPSSTPPRPPLRRPQEGRLFAGVAAGVAENVGMDVAIVRILFVVATIFTSGFGVAAYALAWILIPEATPGESRAPAGTTRRELGGRDPLFWVGVGLLVVGVVWLLDRPGFTPFTPWLRPDRGILVPLVLIAFGIALWRAGDGQRRGGQVPTSVSTSAPPAWRPLAGPADPIAADRSPQETAVNDERPLPSDPEDAPDPGPDPEADRDTTMLPRLDAAGEASEPTAPVGPPPAGFSPPPGSTPPPAGVQRPEWSPPPIPKRESAILVRSTLGLALVTAGVLWLLRVADVIVLGPGRILAAALLVVGLGLLVGTVVGRGRGLIGAGLVLLPIVVIAELVFPTDFELADFRQGAGDHVAAPTDLAELEASYQLGAGSLTVDLTELELTGDNTLSVQVAFGEAIVLVPEDVTVEVTGRAAGGEVALFGRTSSGLGVERTVVDEVEDEISRLELDVRVVFGEVVVRRVPAALPADR